MLRVLPWLLVCALGLSCRSEPEPSKQEPGQGFLWPGRATPSTPAAPPRATRAPAPRRPRPAPRRGKPLQPLPGYTRKLVFQDDFNRASFGPNWSVQGGTWMLRDGAVHSPRARNKCLWLNKPIPADTLLSLEAWSRSTRGDIKFTVFGDGVEHETGYTLIMGGWFNQISIIARMDEHGRDRKERRDPRAVTPGRKYRFEMRRLGGRIEWYVDGRLYLTYDDAAPLRGPGHDRFAFCNWESPLYFDNLKVYALVKR